MKNKTIEARLNKEIEQTVPDIFDSIVNAPIVKMEEHDYITRQSMVKKSKYQKKLLAVCINFILIIIVFTSRYQFSTTDSIIDIDVNPSIEINLNRQGKVLRVNAFNDDANIILGDMNLKKVDLDFAINAIMGSMVKKGYINSNSNAILISVQNKNAVKAGKLHEHIADSITSSLSKTGITPAIVQQNISPDDELKKLSKEYNVSLGKMIFVKQLAGLDNSLDFKKLSKLSLQELMEIIKNNQIDIHKFVNYEDNDFDDDDENEEDNQDDYNDEIDDDSDDKDDNSKITPGINSSKPNQNTDKDTNENKTDDDYESDDDIDDD